MRIDCLQSATRHATLRAMLSCVLLGTLPWSVISCANEPSTEGDSAAHGEQPQAGATGSAAPPSSAAMAGTAAGTAQIDGQPAAEGTPPLPETPGGMVAGRAAEMPAEGIAAATAQSLPLPAGWKGVGVLERSKDKLPKGAPPWARVKAEVVERKGQRVLVTTGRVDNIKNAALARSTAESRARHELTRWTGQERLEGSVVANYWKDKKGKIHLSQAEMVLTPNMLASSGGSAHSTATAPSSKK